MGVPAPLIRTVRDGTERLVDDALELVGYDTRNPPGETTAVIDWLAGQFSDLGMSVERIAVDPAKPNLVATLAGEADRTLSLCGHVDTVPFEPPEWTRDPLGERDGDRVYGRGATDMKGAIAAMLATGRAYVETGTNPPLELQFLLVADEETGGDAGLEALVEAGRVGPDVCVIGEPTGALDRPSVAVADRGSIWLSLEAKGTAAHGSRPTLGENAIDRLIEGVSTLRDRFGQRRLSLDPAVEPIVAESVEYFGPVLGEDEARRLFRYPSINLGTINGGEAINTVPATARAGIDIRLAPGVDTPTVLASIRECMADCPGVSIADVSWSVVSYEPAESPLVDAVAETAAAVTDGRVFRRSATGGGDAKTLRRAGVPTVDFAVAAGTAHAVDEYTSVPALAATAEVYTALPFALRERLE